MTVVLPTPDAGQFHAFTQGDESALKAIFREEYPALIAQAQSALGPDLAHAGTRVVQQAMLTVWRRRTELRTPEGLAAMLEGNVLEEARVQQRKHAALNHRTTGSHAVRHAASLSADDAVAGLDAMLHAPPPDHDRAVEEARAAKKHHAAEHVQSVGRKSNLVWPIALIVIAVVGIVAAQRWAQARGTDIVVTKALQSEDARDITSNRGQRGTVTLGDDSQVRVGSDSKIRVPKDFGGSLRTLELNGTAHFQVARGGALPFTVRAGNMDITAVGTAFTVHAYPADSAVTLMVTEGSVTVNLRDASEKHDVAAGKAVRIARDGSVSPLTTEGTDASFAWTRDSLVFNEAPLSVVVPELARWYDLKLAIGSPAIAERRVSVRMGLESSGAALEAVRKAANLNIEFGKDNEVVLKESATPP